MTGSYTPRPALKIESGYIVFYTVQKRFPAFLRCHARYFVAESEFSEAEVVESALDFRNAVAKLSASPILGPLEGGVPLVMYLAGRGLEEDFKELADELQESSPRVFDLPDTVQPILVAFGDPDAIEDLQLNSKAVTQPVVPAVTPTPEPEPAVAQPEPVAATPVSPAPEPTVEVVPEPTPEPVAEPAPTPAAVESTPIPEAETPAPVETVAVEASPVESPITEKPDETPPAPPPPLSALVVEAAPEPEPVEEAPVETPVVVAPPASVVSAPVTPAPARVDRQATALALGSDYFALRTPDTSGTSVVVWQARRLASRPQADEYEILQPTAETYERLINDARQNVHYSDSQSGELVAIKIALRGSEADLEQAYTLIRQIGAKALKAYYPNPAVEGALWSSDFPAYAVEWVEGSSITESAAFSEPIALDLCAQILELAQAARQAAPDNLLTDSLKPSNILITYDGRGAAHPRIIDWNVFGRPDAEGVAAMLTHLGETMADLFADIRPETYSDLATLGLGRPGDPRLGTWDTVTTGTRTLIRRVLRHEFAGSGDVDAALAAIAQVVADQRNRWSDNDPLWQARLTDSYVEKLNWLDIAAVKLGGLSGEARARLDQSRVDETIDLVTNYAADGRFYDAVFDLRVANRRYPDVSFFRWALLANTVATLSPEGAYKRLRLDEALTLMSIDEFAAARTALDHGVAFFDEVQFEASQRERARDYVSALAMCTQTLALTEQAGVALSESWNVEDAEAKLALAGDRLGRYERLAGDLLHGRDAVCLQKIAEVRQAIDDFYLKHGRYDPYAARRETTEQARRANFNRVVERAWKLMNTDKPADWPPALLLLDRAATEFPDLWKDDHDRERTTLGNKIGTRKLAEAKAALSKGDLTTASNGLAAAMLYPGSHDESARLQAALWTYQRGEIELKRNDLSAALSSFEAAGQASSELRPAAEALAEKAKGQGGTAVGDAVGVEMGKRFAEQQTALGTVVSAAVLAAQEQALARQVAALKQAQAEQSMAQSQAAQKQQADQEERLNANLLHLQRELRDQQAATIKQTQSEQAAAMQKLVSQITDEHTENQRAALSQFQKESANQFKEMQETAPDWFSKSQQLARKAQDEQDKKLDTTLKTIEDTAAWLRTSASNAEAEAQSKAANPVADESVKELGWKLEGNTSTLNRLQGRLNALVGLNVLLLIGLLATFACGGAYLFLPGLRDRLVLPGGAGATSVAVATSAPVVTSLPATAGGPTQAVVIVTEASATEAAPAGAQTLSCANSDQPKSFYDCVVTNLTDRPQNFSLVIAPDQVNGFFYSVLLDGNPLAPDTTASGLEPGAAQFALGNVGTHVSKTVRVGLACTSASGCKTTNFTFKVTGPVETEIPANQVQISTSYTPQ